MRICGLNAEGTTTSAGAGRIWIAKLKAAIHERIRKIDLRPFEIRRSNRVDEERQRPFLLNKIPGALLFNRLHIVLKACAATANNT